MTATKRSYGVTVRRTAPLRLSMHQAAPDQGDWPEWVRGSERPIAVDLFCGAGGLSQGLEAAGYRVVLSADLDPWALETHAHNFEGVALGLDLASAEIRDGVVALFDGLDVDLVAGGPPCQPFSRAGRSKIRHLVENGARGEVDERRELWGAFLDIAIRVRPRAIMMENVPDMALGDDTMVLRHMIGQLEAEGYEVDARIVDTWRHGVPQHRQRLILVGLLDGGRFAWPEPTDGVTVQDAIGDLPVLRVAADEPVGAEVMPYVEPPTRSDFARMARKFCQGADVDAVYDHQTRAVRADDLKAFEMMKAGTLYSDLPEDLQRYRDDIFNDKYNRLGWDDFSRSITAHIAKDGYWYIHPEQHRTLTVRESARIQTFPDHFRFAGTRSHQFHQIGNAVPPALGEAIGSSILKAQRSQRGAETKPASNLRWSFRTKLLAWTARDRVNAPWAYPGDRWPVLVGVLLTGKGASGWPLAEDVLTIAPSFEAATPRVLEALATMADPGVRLRAVRRLVRACASMRTDPLGLDSEDWLQHAGLGPSARRWAEVLSDPGSGLVASSAVLRVTARVTNTDVDRQNRNSAGRMELAKLIGNGPEVAELNTGMHRLGSDVCTAETPSCHRCPLRTTCAGRETWDR